MHRNGIVAMNAAREPRRAAEAGQVMTDKAEARRRLRQRLLDSGATLSTAADTRRVYLTAWLPPDTNKQLLDDAKDDGWVVVERGR